MSRVFAYLIRFAVILFGYVVASLAASAFLNVLFLASLGYAPDQAHPTATGVALFFDSRSWRCSSPISPSCRR